MGTASFFADAGGKAAQDHACGRGTELGGPAPRPVTDAVGHVARQLARDAAELVWPTRCVGCNLPGELLCEDCRAALPWLEQRWACPVCGAPFGYLTCTECDLDWETRAVIAALGFEGAAASMVTNLKDFHELRLAPVMAAAMLCALEEASAWPAPDGTPRFDVDATDAVCFVPATADAYARRGFDHMELVARALAPALGLPLVDVLLRDSARDQRELGREQRAENLAGTIFVADDVSGLDFLLLDDVATTGSSLREAARALLGRGAASVTACVLARVW